MANRMTDTTIWKSQRWFKRLPAIYKLAWKYLTDVCDQAGIWKIDLPELIDDLGVDEFDLRDFIKKCNFDLDKKTGKIIERKRILQFDQNRLWITGFMTFQYGGKTKILNYKNLSVKGSENILRALNLWELGLSEGYFTISEQSPLKPLEAPSEKEEPPEPPLKGHEAHKDKDKVKYKDITNSSSIGKVDTVSNTQDLTKKMMLIYKEAHPKYKGNQLSDEMFCGEIALTIAEINGWEKTSVTNGKMKDVLGEWEKAMELAKTNQYWFSKTPIHLKDFNTYQALHNALNFKDGATSSSKFIAGKNHPNDPL